MRAAEADLPPIPLWGSPALLFTCSPALCRFQPAVSPARKSLTGSGTSWLRYTKTHNRVEGVIQVPLARGGGGAW